jgi:cell shape-determining protein MreC
MKKEIKIFLAIIFLSALFEFVGWLDFFRTVGQKYIVPVSAANVRIIEKISQPYEFIIFTFSKSKYLEQLESQHAIALNTLNEIDALRKENQELKKLLGVGDRKIDKKTIVGSPILSLAYPAIGSGSKEGVKTNDMVLVDQVLVGTIDSVTEYQSKVSLLSTNRKNKIIAKTESGIEGIIDGNGRNVLLTHIPRDTEVAEGERVVTSGQEGIEKNIFIGTIKKIKQNPSDSTQTFVVSQLVSFYDSIIVEVK